MGGGDRPPGKTSGIRLRRICSGSRGSWKEDSGSGPDAGRQLADRWPDAGLLPLAFIPSLGLYTSNLENHGRTFHFYQGPHRKETIGHGAGALANGSVCVLGLGEEES